MYRNCCDLLEKSYLCGINNNKQGNVKPRQDVVICLKSLTFVVSITTQSSNAQACICCDLLEKSYLCGINNNYSTRRAICGLVVICLKSLTFVVSITTQSSNAQACICCDLLEKSYLCGINNNPKI